MGGSDRLAWSTAITRAVVNANHRGGGGARCCSGMGLGNQLASEPRSSLMFGVLGLDAWIDVFTQESALVVGGLVGC